MKVRLLNSAMMPKEGIYTMQKITKEQFCNILKEAYQKGILDSYIGYQENIDLIAKWTGIIVPFNRSETIIEHGDIMLVMKLKYRLKDPRVKGVQTFKEEDFEFFMVNYEKI